MPRASWLVPLSLSLVMGMAAPAFAAPEALPADATGLDHLKAAYRESLRKAYEGDLEAQHKVAFSLQYGLGISRSPQKAIDWYRRAAERNHGPSMFALGQAYADGEMVPKDLALALGWYRSAAEQGDAKAMFALAGMYETGEGVPKDRALAESWYRRAAEGGYVLGQRWYGRMLWTGQGVKKDVDEAERWLKKAAAGGDDEAMAMLSIFGLSERLTTVRSDAPDVAQQLNAIYSAERVGWIRRASELGNVKTQGMLAFLHAQGIGVEQDALAAAVWAELALMGPVFDRSDAEARKRLPGILEELKAKLSPAQRDELARRVSAWVAAHPQVSRVHSRVLPDGRIETTVHGTKQP